MSEKQNISVKTLKEYLRQSKLKAKEGRAHMIKSAKDVQTLGPQMTLEGKLVFEGTVRLDGHLKGTIESKEGTMIVGEEAVVHADILVHTANVRQTALNCTRRPVYLETSLPQWYSLMRG